MSAEKWRGKLAKAAFSGKLFHLNDDETAAIDALEAVLLEAVAEAKQPLNEIAEDHVALRKRVEALETLKAERDAALARVKYLDGCLLLESNAKEARPSATTVAKVVEALLDAKEANTCIGGDGAVSRNLRKGLALLGAK